MTTKLDEHISFIGKCVLIEDEFLTGGKKIRRRILVLGDLHLGYEDSSLGIPMRMIFQETLEDLRKVFGAVEKKKGFGAGKGEVDEIVILGDVKHFFGGILDQEWKETRKFFSYLKEKCKKIIVVKGNHDTILEPIAREFGFELADYYLLGKYGFLHGDKMFDALLEKKIKVFFCGHLHPAITLREGVKSERYKCFLAGSWRGKKVIVLPSFFPLVEGADVLIWEGNLGFDFSIEKSEVYLVGDAEVLYFGKMGKLVRG